jgi:bifunctional ADP-heptose synthase (sugar kinase/adenylyltransferase)
MITPTLFDKVNEMAVNSGIPTAVDPKKRNFNHYKNVSLFKPNFKELVDGSGIPIEKGDFETIKKVADSIKQKQNFKIIFVTLSELGVFISNGVKEQYYPAIIRYIADVSGAGDTVISVAGLALASGLSPEMMALMSNLAGGLVCEKTGVVPVDKNQLINEMKSQKK